MLLFLNHLTVPLSGTFHRAFRRAAALSWIVVLSGLGLPEARAQTDQKPTLRVSYLAELPVSWGTSMGDPLEKIAWSLSRTFVRPVDRVLPSSPNENLSGAESWEELAKEIKLGETDLFPIQGYEFILKHLEGDIKPLLLATRSEQPYTQFMLLSYKPLIQNLEQLKDKTVLVHRDGCGYLVDYWLDDTITKGTGELRKNFAHYQTVTTPREAILPVFFGEADACVVSVAAYQSVVSHNPIQIPDKLLQLGISEKLPSQIVACKFNLTPEIRRQVLEEAPHITWDFGEAKCGFIAADDAAFQNLRDLLKPRNPAAPSPVKPVMPRTAQANPKPIKRP
jgi:hypothetical protein